MDTWTQVCIPVPTAKGIDEAIRKLHRFTLTYPIFCAALLLMWSYHPEIPFKFMYNVLYAIPRAIFYGILDVLGFGREGVRRDTLASNYQSNHYGGYLPPNSLFSTYQSYGAVNDLEINWMSRASDEENRGTLMTTLSYVLLICSFAVLYDGFKARF